MKFFTGFCLVSLLFFFVTCNDKSAKEGSFVTVVNAQNKQVEAKSDVPTDKDQLEIAKFLISIAKVNSKDICNEKQNIYFSTNELSKYVLDNFPRKIKDCKTILIKEDEIGKDFKYDYHRFSRWSWKSELFYVTFSTNFWGGNVGGGYYVLEKKEGKWIIKSSEFWAHAS